MFRLNSIYFKGDLIKNCLGVRFDAAMIHILRVGELSGGLRASDDFVLFEIFDLDSGESKTMHYPEFSKIWNNCVSYRSNSDNTCEIFVIDEFLYNIINLLDCESNLIGDFITFLVSWKDFLEVNSDYISFTNEDRVDIRFKYRGSREAFRFALVKYSLLSGVVSPDLKIK